MARVTSRENHRAQFLTRIGWAQAHRKPIAGDASNRSYERLTHSDGSTAILMDAPSEKGEGIGPFTQIAKWLNAQGFSAPQVYHMDEALGLALMEDLGDDLFARLIETAPGREASLYRAATDALIALHRVPAPDLPACDATWLTQMTDLFFDWYCPDARQVDHPAFADVFHPLAQSLNPSHKVAILRDFHVENLLWLPDRAGFARVGLLDFQDALLGHPAYDLMSLLLDARRDTSAEVRDQMIQHYAEKTGQNIAEFRRAFSILGVQRNLRILGVFVRLCLRDDKPQYLDKVPRVWGHVMHCLAHPALSELKALLDPVLSPPSPAFLQKIKDRCSTSPAQ